MMIPQQSTVQTLGKLIKCLLFTSMIYPLERLQVIKQIQSTYSNLTFKQTKFIVSQSLHNGIKASFRGYMSFITKASVLTFTSKFAQINSHNQNYKQLSKLIELGLLAVSYAIVYPYQIVNIRMSSQIQRKRYYQNVRECFSKIKKNEGIKTLYRGFLYSYAILASQLGVIQLIQQNLQNQKSSEWSKIGQLAGSIAVSQLLIYPFSSVKKLYQINGAIGHDNFNYSLRATIRNAKTSELFKGYSIRMLNILSYSLLYLFLMDEDISA